MDLESVTKKFNDISEILPNILNKLNDFDFTHKERVIINRHIVSILISFFDYLSINETLHKKNLKKLKSFKLEQYADKRSIEGIFKYLMIKFAFKRYLKWALFKRWRNFI